MYLWFLGMPLFYWKVSLVRIHVSSSPNLLTTRAATEPELTSEPSRKRGPPDDAPFERIVKRLIVRSWSLCCVLRPESGAQIDASKGISVPSQRSSVQLSAVGPTNPPIGASESPRSHYSSENGNDILAPGALFCDEEIFSGSQFDESIMAELSRLLYSNPFGYPGIDLPATV